MASRALVLAAALLLVLLILLPGGARADTARRRAKSVHHRKHARQISNPSRSVEVDAEASYRSAAGHRKLGQKSKPSQSVEVDVAVGDGHGAVGDGQHDDTPAFEKAWAAVCPSSKPATLLVPKGKTYLLSQITFSGQCKSSVTFKLDGKLVAPISRSSWTNENIRRWVVFVNVNSLTVTGDGMLDGNGKGWWQNSCRVNKNPKCTKGFPTVMLLSKCNNLKVENIRFVNSQQIYISVEDCRDVILKHITITAPGDSSETDGIHIALTKDIQLLGCNIKTGDDCISIETGIENLYSSRITCGPGHGISVGSLGDNNSEARVSNITIYKAHLHATTNGARVNSWQGGKWYAKDIQFEDIIVEGVKNPIIIDQNYFTAADPSKPKAYKKQNSAVEFRNIRFKNIRDTSSTNDAIKLDWSDMVPCQDILLKDVKLTLSGSDGSTPTSVCNNVKLKKSANVFLRTC